MDRFPRRGPFARARGRRNRLGAGFGRRAVARAVRSLAIGGLVVAAGLPVSERPVGAATVPTRAFAGGETRELVVTGQAGVPTDGVSAVVVNLTATATVAAGYVVAWPSGQPMPATSNLNTAVGDDRANLAIVPVGDGGRISIANRGGRTDLIADVVGWIPEDAGYTAFGPQRLFDSRTIGRPLRAGQAVRVALGDTVPAGSLAVVNLTGVDASAPSHLVAWPAGEPMPPTSNLNVVTGGAVANLAFVAPGAGGALDLTNHAGSIDVVVDLLGWFTPTSGVTAIPATRLADTRTSGGPLGAAGVADVGAAEVGATTSGAAVLTLTGIQRTRASFVTAWSASEARPPTSNLNLLPGRAVANLAVVHLDGSQLRVENSAGTADVIVDALAWAADTSALRTVPASRLMDTRLAAGPAEVPPPARARRTIMYSIAFSGTITADLAEFADQVAETLADARGWTRAGVGFARSASGGDVTVWLVAAGRVPSFGSPCTVNYSCRVGRNVVVNQDRWVGASAAWNATGASLRDYRHMVVNHEVGHWLGKGHAQCRAAGGAAPVMQQQSKDLAGCLPNPWPLDAELAGAGAG